MDRRGFLKGTFYTGIMISSSDGLLNALLNANITNNRQAVKMIGIGGRGIAVVNAAIKYGLKNVEFITIDTDADCLKQSNAENKIHINSFRSCMIDACIVGDPIFAFDIGQKILSPYADKIMPFISGAEKVFIVAGLGGETATFMTPVIAAMAHESGALTMAILTCPFGIEGYRKHCMAENCLAAMEEHSYSWISIAHDQFVNKDEKLPEYFTRCDQHTVKAIESSMS